MLNGFVTAVATWLSVEVAKATTKVVSKATSKATTKSSTKNSDKNTRQHTVYKLVDKITNKVEYVGRTKDVPRTIVRHKANPYRTHLKFEVIRENLNWYEARGWEQYYINFYKTKNKSNPMNNQINGLREAYWNRPEFSEYVFFGLKALSPESITYVGE